ncbi:MAG: SDR family NAD(P)-dependent oxidoreductase [Synergistaceae bacterium]|nr:SDR family NAD(P)-dependent oxidoreductase [Synergistaceae bacterium]
MATKTIIITGGNSGLGFETAKNIAGKSDEYFVILACRNFEKGISAAEKIKNETGNQNICSMELDLASLKSVRNFAEKIKTPIYALDNNAGISGAKTDNQITVDGFDIIFQSNHLGHFLLTNLLLPLMSEDSRILNISSDMHNPPYGALVWNGTEYLAHPTENLGNERYFYSKLCNLYFTYELDRKLKEKNSNISCNAFNPGFMPDTNLNSMPQSVIDEVKTKMPERLGSLSVSSKAVAKLLTEKEFSHVSGKYFSMSTTPVKSSELSYNLENARELWKISSKFSGLN